MWNRTIADFMIRITCKSDHCVYVKRDDSDEFLTSTKRALSDRFKLTDLGELKHSLVVKIKSDHAAGHVTMSAVQSALDARNPSFSSLI